jgi:2',3'-cyclic-nucleotide 2'-phosphodiesterase (5'-nucleotidase family)
MTFNRRLGLPGLVVAALFLMVSCGGQDTREVAASRTAVVESLQQDIASLRAEVAALSQDTGDSDAAAAQANEFTSRLEAMEAEIAVQGNWANTWHSAAIDRLDRLTADSFGTPEETGISDSSPEPAFTLQLLHASDMDGATGGLANVENFSAILDSFRGQYPDNTLVLSSGDNYVPGPRYYAAGDEANNPALGVSGNGRGDIALLNAMGFQASALGNHELDRGTREFAATIRFQTGNSGTYPGARFPYLARNLVFSGDHELARLVVPNGQEVLLVGGSLAGSAVITISGEQVGVVGVTTPALEQLTGTGGITVLPGTDAGVEALAEIVQQEVDSLTRRGITKIILLAHMQQLTIERELSTRLADVDIIVAGGSKTILADATDRLRAGDEAADTYPLLLESPRGEPVVLVNTDGDYRYLGRLVIDFDEEGLILSESIDPYTSGAYATDRQGGQEFAGRPIPEVSRIVASLRRVLGGLESNLFGRTSVYLAGNRTDVRTQETNLGNLTADANLWMARQVDPEVSVSLKNGGGIRDSIGLLVQPPGATNPSDVMFRPPPANPETGRRGRREGDISQFDIEGALRFNNGLVIIPLTARQLAEVIEHTVGFDGVGKATVGRFPHVAGMRFSFDPTAPSGERIRSLAIVDDSGMVTDRVVEGGALSGDPEKLIKMVTLDFLANRGDGYPFPVPSAGRIDLRGERAQPNPPDPDFPDTNGNSVLDGPVLTDSGLADFASPGTEQDALAEYLAHFHTETPINRPETPPLEDQRIQNLGIPGKRDSVFE